MNNNYTDPKEGQEEEVDVANGTETAAEETASEESAGASEETE